MEAFFEGIFTHMPDWFFFLVAIIILITLGGSAWWILLGAKRFSDSLGKERKLYELQEDLQTIKSDADHQKGISLKLLNVVDNSRLFLNSINNLDMEGNFGLNLQRVVESLASDVKARAGEKHRSGFWVASTDKQTLTLMQGSSGFPDHYLGNRVLGFNQSIAGRCFRKNQLINCENVKEDEDYESSENDYKSLICVPVNNFGILTVDGKEPFDKSVESIVELYGAIIELILNELAKEMATAELESASTVNQNGEEDNNVRFKYRNKKSRY